ncbi:MAG: UPF0280 family protein [Vallitaleaceae bacterium]|jgi:ApbE superfamily uncharacterized protein (UPF0280 family)|nr:UPF0280 family protein [Vallitaleaceae bacterium]
MYQKRFYRNSMIKGMNDSSMVSYEVLIEESDLWIMSDAKHEALAIEKLKSYRAVLTAYGKAEPLFFESLEPLDCMKDAHPMIVEMHTRAKVAGVGPMAGVAGAISKYVGLALLAVSSEVIIENGGDIFMKSNEDRTIAISAGRSKLSQRIGIKIKAEDTPIGICTSAGTVGHSLSFGRADAVVVVSKDVILADQVATAMGNIVKKAKDIKKAIEAVIAINSSIDMDSNLFKIKGIIIIIEDQLGVWGDIEIVKL